MDELSNDLLKSRVRAKSLVDAVTERLEAAILGGELAPGSRLSEQRLATAFGVSRGPLREAIRRLEGRQLLRRTTNIGVHVTELSHEDLAELMTVRVMPARPPRACLASRRAPAGRRVHLPRHRSG